MLVTFTTDAHADITMFGDVALAMLKMMGHSATVPGALAAEDVRPALDRLVAAVRVEEQSAEPATSGGDDDDEPPVSLSHRALWIRLSRTSFAHC